MKIGAIKYGDKKLLKAIACSDSPHSEPRFESSFGGSGSRLNWSRIKLLKTVDAKISFGNTVLVENFSTSVTTMLNQAIDLATAVTDESSLRYSLNQLVTVGSEQK